MSIYGNVVGGGSGLGKTFIFEDEAGNTFTGVAVDNEVVFTATDNDVREGLTYVSGNGVSTGTKIIPTYYASHGEKIVMSNKEASIYMPKYDYDSLIVTISTYNTSMSKSTVSTYVSIDNGMYTVGSNNKLSDITTDKETQQIKLGITVSEKSVLRYFVVTEEI